MRKKKYASLCFCGHVSSGKSSLLGKLIYLLGGVDVRTINRFEKMIKESHPTLNDEFTKFSWILDRLKSERDSLHSVDWAAWTMWTQKMELTLVDVPGRVDYMKNALTGISLADHMAGQGLFESSISQGGQARDFLTVAFANGFTSIVIIVTKMDRVQYDEERYNFITEKLRSMMNETGFSESFIDSVPVIPVSCHGPNLIELDQNKMKWWSSSERNKYAGKTVLQVFDSYVFEKAEEMDSEVTRLKELPLRISIVDTYRIGGIGYCYCGKVCSGNVRPGMKVRNSHLDFKEMEIRSLERHHRPVEKTSNGVIALNLRPGMPREKFYRKLKRGGVIGDLENPPKNVSSFTAEIRIIESGIKLKKGSCPVVNCHANHFPCSFLRIERRISEKKQKEEKEEEKEEEEIFLCEGQVGIVELKPMKKTSLETYEFCKRLGTILIRDQGKLIGYGKVLSVVYEDNEK